MQDIEYLKNERRILDYELVEERFHYESIAARKSNSKAKALNALFLAVPATVIVLLCLKMILHSMRVGLVNSGVVGGVGILFSTFGIAFGGLASIILWRKFFSEMKLFKGNTSNYYNQGSNNYSDEEYTSNMKIRSLLARIEEIDHQIDELRNNTVHKKEVAIHGISPLVYDTEGDEPELTQEELFFNYAYGKWGDEREKLLFGMKSDKYEKEEASIQDKIEKNKRAIIDLGRVKAQIEKDYAKAKNYILIYVLGILVLSFIELIMIDSNISIVYMQWICMFYGLSGVVFLYFKCKTAFLNYMVENKPNLVKTYIYDKNIITTTKRKEQLHREMEELNHRLSYVQKILEFKESHIIN